MKVDWGAVVRAIVAGDASGRGDPSPDLASLADTDPAGAMALSAHLAVTGDLTGFMSTRAPEADPDPGEGPGGPPPERVGAWKLAERIGSGGMGQVWLVRRDDGVYDQIAAMKLVASPAAMVMDRFRDERQRLARLDHPNIARIIDGGEDTAGRPFMVVEFVEGAPIADWCAGRGCDPRTRVRLLVDLCDALAHAHARLVLHLDIKSANVLVNSDGQLRLIDFGIAALIPEAAMADTHRQGRALTLVTAAPEQLEGEAVSVATDIFQVGMLAHLLLIGRLPERQADGSVVIAAQALGNPDLAAIIARATAFDPANRYASVDALGEDLLNWLETRPVMARGGGSLYRARVFLKKHWLASAASAVALAALVGGLGVSLLQTQQAINARNRALAEEERSDTIRESLYFLLAETGEGEDGAATASGVSQAAEVIGARFRKAPAQFAAVLQALGELQFYLSDDVGALATFDLLLGQAAVIDPEILAQARYNAAQAHMRQGAADKAEALLGQAQAFWKADPGRWAIRLRDSRLLEAQVMRAEDPEGAVALLRRTLADHVREYGRDNQRAGVFANNIGTALVSLGRLDEAEAAFLEADRVWQATGLTGSFDALNTLNNVASVQYLQNKHEAAVASFARAVALRDQLFGPSAATAALLSNYGKALLGVDKAGAALEPLARAEAMSLEFAGPASALHVAVLNGHAEALAKAGRAGAVEKLGRARQHLTAMGDPPPLLASWQLASGKVALAETRPDEARSALREAVLLAQSSGPAGERIRAEAQGLLDAM
ncbi:hypothetical protein CHX26_01135 [Porphyrobacter sp. HT-58-2]|uniref:serine/threonine-protein kinase n=1 Tax=Porphyrobacter sp. HT-58-2 TaxID=2023229 RepID=UPI000CDC832B|nr:serine/threonine-protein kinase [Porphyrobacter sp. HT-58-2]AUX68306.1 hypothetical protein CHX26_01135 [Porphyrobacter sp. HT-58-2]